MSGGAEDKNAGAWLVAGPRLHRDSRDEKLWLLLPAKDALYDFRKLSKAETDALVVALGDGFGGVSVSSHVGMPLPNEVKSGVLQHSFYVGKYSEYDPNEGSTDEFWENIDDEQAPYEAFPLRFHTRRLRVYFQNQFDRFSFEYLNNPRYWCTPPEPNATSYDDYDWICKEEALQRLYEKPWYEVHALQFLDWIEDREREYQNSAPSFLTFMAWVKASFAGQLGRLIEQYYWRFRFEEAAVAGMGARQGASAGGKASAELHRRQRTVWQDAASKIWDRRPSLSKLAVADQVRKQLQDRHTARHIARYITRP